MTDTLIIIGVIAFWIVAMVVVALAYLKGEPGARGRERLLRNDDDLVSPDEAAARLRSDDPRGLTKWLYLAGYRSESAPTVFLLATAMCGAVGFLLALGIVRSGFVGQTLDRISNFPGGSLELVSPILLVAPWLIFFILIMVPTVLARARRRRRVAEIEVDLPVTLELLATLAEAGLGFDAALERVVRSQSNDRLLAREFRAFQGEVRSGRPRVRSLRRLARRIDVASMNMLVSALVQAEQVGSGIASVLRRQAEDMRARRRERAIEFSMALPVKRLLPMVICFLPAIFVAALGPAFYKLFTQTFASFPMIR